ERLIVIQGQITSGDTSDDFDDLKRYFSKTEWIHLVKAEKVRYRSVRRNHLAMLAIGLNSPVPAFMRKGRPQMDNTAPLFEPSDSEEEDEWTPHLERYTPGRTAVNLKTLYLLRYHQESSRGSLQIPPTDCVCVSGLSKRQWLERRGQTQDLNYQRGKNLRDRTRVSYIEEEEPKDDHFLFCEDCCDFFIGKCELHGAPVFIPDTPAPQGAPDRARLTLPPGLEIKTSGIPGAGLGVFNQGDTVAVGTHYGPYEGENTEKDQAMESGYSWVIYKNRLLDDYIDAKRETYSNWMRYVNCARNEEEQNLVAFQYRGGILYRCCKPIAVGDELLVWYGEEYARDLGICICVCETPEPEDILIKNTSCWKYSKT
uniref:SET domain-containing protein n=1 Tax=Esox lucius TaxID=8010 RepID=A0A3P8XLZ3_ESOLU